MANAFLHHDPEPIPELPADTEVDARHVAPEDVENYKKPLYTRFWGIGVSRVKYDRGDKQVSRMLPQLSKGFSFVHHAAALQFMSEIISIAREGVSSTSHSHDIVLTRTICSIPARLL